METLNILCFGDSLTEGYSGWGSCFTPYGDPMKAWLNTELASTNVVVEVNGRSGDLVDEAGGQFMFRIRTKCSKTITPFDWIIILGGTNDLGMGRKADHLFSGLKKVYGVALEHGANVLALTVPECAVVIPDLDARRKSLNAMITEYKPEGFEERFHTLDLFSLMPYHSESEEAREEIWDDGLHFTPYGYHIIGDYVAQRLVELLKIAKNPKHSVPPVVTELNGVGTSM